MAAEQVKAWLIPLGLIALGAVLGPISERVVLPRLSRHPALRTGGEIFVSSLRG